MTAQIEKSNDEYKIICRQCQHFVRIDEESAEKYNNDPESFHCPLCYVKSGEPKLVRSLIHCATCNQTYDSRTVCECIPAHSTINITYDPKHKWMKNRVFDNTEAYNSKTMIEYNKKVRNRKLEAEERQIRVDENLSKKLWNY